jgi:hypothetical protein
VNLLILFLLFVDVSKALSFKLTLHSFNGCHRALSDTNLNETTAQHAADSVKG